MMCVCVCSMLLMRFTQNHTLELSTNEIAYVKKRISTNDDQCTSKRLHKLIRFVKQNCVQSNNLIGFCCNFSDLCVVFKF